MLTIQHIVQHGPQPFILLFDIMYNIIDLLNEAEAIWLDSTVLPVGILELLCVEGAAARFRRQLSAFRCFVEHLSVINRINHIQRS